MIERSNICSFKFSSTCKYLYLAVQNIINFWKFVLFNAVVGGTVVTGRDRGAFVI